MDAQPTRRNTSRRDGITDDGALGGCLGPTLIPISVLFGEGLRAVREVLIKYRGVLTGTHLAAATTTARFDWVAPYRMPWAVRGFREPLPEEERSLTDDERRADDEQRRKLGFSFHD